VLQHTTSDGQYLLQSSTIMGDPDDQTKPARLILSYYPRERSFARTSARAAKWLAMTVAVIAVLYVGAYFALVTRGAGTWPSFDFSGSVVNNNALQSGNLVPGVFSETYRIGGDRSQRLFRPMNRFDRRIRAEYWTSYGPVEELAPAMRKAIAMANDGDSGPYFELERAYKELYDIMPGTKVYQERLEKCWEVARKIDERWAERQKR
jgi:hypothetical protein